MIYDRINIIEALAQLGNSEKLYKTLVTGFFDRYQGVDLQIEALIRDDQMDEARRVAHSIKGLCGNLGTNQLRERAKDLEYAIRDQSIEIDECMSAFSVELEQVMIEVDALIKDRFSDHNIKEESLVYGEGLFLEACATMKSALETYRYSDVKWAYGKICEIEIPEKYKEMMKALRTYIEDYEYEWAINVINELEA